VAADCRLVSRRTSAVSSRTAALVLPALHSLFTVGRTFNTARRRGNANTTRATEPALLAMIER
jgi:hypothetical protein